MIKGILRHTPHIGIAIVGLASALLVLEIKRLPAIHFVEHEIFYAKLDVHSQTELQIRAEAFLTEAEAETDSSPQDE